MTVANDPDSVRELLKELARTLVRWSYEGTEASEFAVAEIARAYGVDADITFLAESAFLRVGDQTVVVTRRPDVPPLDQVRDVRLLVAEIMCGGVPADTALTRLRAIMSRHLRWSFAFGMMMGFALIPRRLRVWDRMVG